MKFEGMRNFFSNNAHNICIYGGIGAVAAAIGFTVYGSLKVAKIIQEHKAEKDRIIETREVLSEEFSEKDCGKAVVKMYADTGFKFVKAYSPAFVLASVGFAAIIKGSSILNKRNLALSSALAAVSGSYNTLKNRISTKYGKDVLADILHGNETVELKSEEEDVDGDKVSSVEVTKTATSTSASPYTFVFNEDFTQYTGDRDMDQARLFKTFDILTKRLEYDHYITWNDFLDTLGYTKDKPAWGMTIGWIYIPDKAAIDVCACDSYIDGILSTSVTEGYHDNGAKYFKKCWVAEMNCCGDIQGQYSRLLSSGAYKRKE